MLKSITEGKHSSKLTVLQDTIDVSLIDLFKVVLTNFIKTEDRKEIHVVCLENPPDLYLPDDVENTGINIHDNFKDPCNWNNTSTPGLESLRDLSGKILFVDSLYHFVQQLGCNTAYRLLHHLKVNNKTIISVIHEDLFNVNELENFLYLSTTCIRINSNPNELCEGKNNKKIVSIKYKKPNNKISTQNEVFFITDGFKLSSEICKSKVVSKKVIDTGHSNFESLTTFELGLQMRDNEKQAKQKLVLPYLKCQEKHQETGDIIYNLEDIDLEEDPDDDLDI